MAGNFANLMGRLHRVGLPRLADSVVDHLDAQGATLVAGLDAMVDRDVERLDQGRLERAVTVTVSKSSLQPFDRKGAYRVNGEVFVITDIASDDGHLISFFVKVRK
ncbi:hypothetical protein SAMN05216201_11171 [Pseudomonas linyingensis]|uniref:Uncharacterized protein n=1 Tax=Pseudomonas linyingensis TaxID=915471 RepID=A0A1H7A7R8_9PSED|nr:hypothetical protein [Pseudomonas linyingensis]SEJ57920.1 hypothetical protein SAMN05216201_11171 [Pseudomonas linyingensis]